MPHFSADSLRKLATCDVRLQRICLEVIKYYDFTVLCGHRTEEEQNKAFKDGKSRAQWPLSMHNKKPSLAIDVAPFPIDWKNTERFYLLAGMMFAEAHKLNIRLRWGGDWDKDWEHKDQKLTDLPHFELVTQ